MIDNLNPSDTYPIDKSDKLTNVHELKDYKINNIPILFYGKLKIDSDG